MKRFIIAITIIGLAATSCSLNPIDEPIVMRGKTVPVTINARQGDETKTVRNADKSVSWMPSEKILVICGDDGGIFTSTNTDNSPTVSFTGELDESTVNAVNNGTSAFPVLGLYPYDENVESDGSTYVTTTLPSNQTGVAGTFADDLFISLAKSDDFNLYFYNVCSGFKFSVTKAGVTSITIQGKNNEYLAGEVKLSFGEDGKPKVDEVLNGQEVITLTPEKSTFEVGKDYYFVTLPTNFSEGFTVTFTTPSETGVFTVSSSLSFPRSKFVAKANVDEAVSYISNISIPDENFKAYCVANFDDNGDGEISYAEALNITDINVCTDNIETVQGIEFMLNLSTLSLVGSETWNETAGRLDYNGKLSSLNISNNSALTFLDCGHNKLTALDVSRNKKMTQLFCHHNQLTAIDVSQATAMTWFECVDNQLTTLIVSDNTALTIFDCSENKLTALNVSNNTALTYLGCGANQLTTLDVSHNTALTVLDCPINQLTSLNVSNNTALTKLNCDWNNLSSLVLGDNSVLKTLWCGSNQLTSLDVSNLVMLTYLDCFENNISTLTVTNNFDLTDLNCYKNNIQELDVSNNSKLKTLCCHTNQLSTLDISNNSALSNLSCESNQLTSLVISNNASLLELWCSNNHISSLDISSCTKLKTLQCHTNQLSSLIVSNNADLENLVCHSNNLTSLDVSNNSALTCLHCYNNPYLTEIWLKTGQTIPNFMYNSDEATIKYK